MLNVNEDISTWIKNGSGTGSWVEGQRSRRDIDNFAANFNSNQVNIIEWWSSRVSEKWSILDPLGLIHRPKSQRPTKVRWLKARQTVRECGLVEILALGQERQWASAQAQQPLLWCGTSCCFVNTAKSVAWNWVSS